MADVLIKILNMTVLELHSDIADNDDDYDVQSEDELVSCFSMFFIFTYNMSNFLRPYCSNDVGNLFAIIS